MTRQPIIYAIAFVDANPEAVGDELGRPAPDEEPIGAIFVRVPLTVREDLKRLAIDRRSTSQKLMEEALDDLFIKYRGKPR
jgi:hypothetical protein